MNNSEKVLRLLMDYLTTLELEYQPTVYLGTKARVLPEIETWGITIRAPESADRAVPLTTAFIDLMPDANYEHPVKYVFIDENSCRVHSVNATTPPNFLGREFQKIEMDIPIRSED